MLKFIFGRPSSGKSYTMLEYIKKAQQAGDNSVLIVPEQYSFEAEKSVLHTVGERAALGVSVMSFSRIYDEVGRVVGGTAGRLLSDSDKIIIMKRALKEAKEDLILWSKYTASTSFAKSALDIIGEFKINAVTPDILRKTADCVNSVSLKNKLVDTALIFENYNMILGERFIDPADKLTKLYEKLEQFEFFKGKNVFIDSFKGFTGQQYKIIDRIFSQAKNVYICLNNDIHKDNEFGIYSNIQKTVERIKRSAAKSGVSSDEPIFLSQGRYNSGNLKALERLMAGENVDVSENDGSITVCKASNTVHEANFAARTIRKLVRKQGYRYRDFVIIARSAEDYEEAVELACKQNGIGCFTDKRIPLSAFPVPVAVFSAINAAASLSTEDILRFHKTGLGTLETEEISLLENYTAIWNISGSAWKQNWDMDIRGFVTEEQSQEEKEALLEINALRERAIAPILNFREGFKGTALSMTGAIVKLLKECDMADHLKRLSDDYKTQGNSFSADTLSSSYGMFMGILDSIVNCYNEAEIKRDDFVEALSMAVDSASVGAIPQTLDEVTFGSADRIRPSRPKVAFILGANQGVFPAGIGKSGLLNIREREQLIESGIEIADNSVSSATDEDYLVYTSVCCPSDKLYISYYSSSLIGEEGQPSPFVKTICEKISCNLVNEPNSSLNDDNIPETAQTAFNAYCENFRIKRDDAATLEKSLEDTEYKNRIAALKESQKRNSSISKDAAKGLYGKEIYMSASKLDTFNRCKFSYFCRYGLKLKKLQPADFDALQRGTIVHYVLERVVTDYGKNIAALSQDEISSAVDKYIEEYLDSICGYRTVENERMRFIISRISRSLKEVVAQMAREFAQSDFEPYRCEMKIGSDGEIPELVIPYSEGNIHITGSIDRVDKYNGYIRVIDYKTGSRSFKLPDILFGLNLQMLIYLYAAVRGVGSSDENAAGIFYLHSKRDLNESGMAMNGLAQGNLKLITAMEKENKGEFVPKLSLNKDGTISKRNASFVSAEDFTVIFDHIEKLIGEIGNKITEGQIDIDPVDGRESPACKYCDYAAICGIEEKQAEKVPAISNSEVINRIRGDIQNGD